MSIDKIRYGVAGVGVLAGLYGAWLLLSRQDFGRLENVALWMLGGVVVHDFVIAPIVIGLAWSLRSLPMHWRRAATVATVVLGSLSLLAIPVLTRLGARSDNPTLLDRPYLTSWMVLAGVSVVLVVVAGLVGSRLDHAVRVGDDGESVGR